MANYLDEELRKAFNELQAKMIETSDQIQLIDSQMESLQRAMVFVELTRREISTYPIDVKTYESVGRMFILTDLRDCMNNLKDRETQINARAEELANNKKYLENNLKNSEDNIREMVKQKKEQSDPKSN